MDDGGMGWHTVASSALPVSHNKMKIFACIVLMCLCGALAAPEKKAEEPKRDKRGYLAGGVYPHAYPAYSGYYGGNLGYAGYGGHLGYAGHGGHLGYSTYVAPAAEVVVAPAVGYAAYPQAVGGYYGGLHGGHYAPAYVAPHSVHYAGNAAGWW